MTVLKRDNRETLVLLKLRLKTMVCSHLCVKKHQWMKQCFLAVVMHMTYASWKRKCWDKSLSLSTARVLMDLLREIIDAITVNYNMIWSLT